MWRRTRATKHLDDDIRDHLARETEENVARGMAPDEARRQALLKFGNVSLANEDTRAVWTWGWLQQLVLDTRYALRTLRRTPAFTVPVVITLALGIGANTVIYSFFEAILLRPLPVTDPDSLVVMKWRAKTYTLARTGMSWSTGGSWSDDSNGTSVSSIFPFPALELFETSDSVLTTAFGYFIESRLGVTVGDQTDSLMGQYVTGTYFEGMGVAPAAGRLIQPGDDRDGTAAVAVISHRFGQRRFGDPRAAVGQTIRVNDSPFLIVGVAPAAFFGAEPGAIPDVYLPMRAQLLLTGAMQGKHFLDPHYYWVEIMARLKPGVSLSQAQAALAPRFLQFAATSASTDKQREDLPQLQIEPGANGLDTLRRRYAQPIFVLMSMVGLLLLIACSNIASLLLARAAVRRREFAVRLSLGASRWRVIRQLLTESVLLSLLGAALAVGIAWWGIRGLTLLLAIGRDNFTLHAALNWPVLGITVLLSVVCGLLFGLAPALRSAHLDITPALKDKDARQRVALWRRLGFRHSLVTVQIALSLVLLVAASLFGRTLSRLHAIELGFAREDVLLFTVRPSTVGYSGPALTRLYEDLRVRLARLPGAQAVSLSVRPMPMGGGTSAPIDILGSTPESQTGEGSLRRAALATVAPRFFETMRMPLVAGRDFTDRDVVGPRVVVVNRRLADLFGLDNPVGHTLTLAGEHLEIVGVVEDALAFFLKEERRAILYFSYLQSARPNGQMTYEIRTAGRPSDLAASVRQVVHDTDSRLAIHDLKTQAAHVDQAISTEITLARLGAAFGGLALAIACVGIYGTVAFRVAQRTTEIGIRMALGARTGRILWMVLRDVFWMAVAGFALGIPFVLAGSGYVRALLYGIQPTDPLAIGLAVTALLMCGLVAGLVPARRASLINPLTAIRSE